MFDFIINVDLVRIGFFFSFTPDDHMMMKIITKHHHNDNEIGKQTNQKKNPISFFSNVVTM